MGCIIRPDTEGGSIAALAETGTGGLLSTGYLRDAPAREYLDADETPAFVVTNTDRGVLREDEGEDHEITPGESYRTICVVTDQRLLVLVGDAGEGDERVALPFADVDGAAVDDGALAVGMRSGETWRIHAGEGEGLESVAGYVEDVAAAWADIEAECASIEQLLDRATQEAGAEEYEAAIETATEAHDEVGVLDARLEELPAEWPVDALAERVGTTREACVETLAGVSVERGESLIERAERAWRDGRYELAQDRFERARTVFEAVQPLQASHHDRAEAVTGGLERVEQALTDLAEAPLERAIETDHRAQDAEDAAAAVADYRCARRQYREALELVTERSEFAGDPDRIRDRIETVTKRLLETAREHGAEALNAGTWFLEAGQPRVAYEESRVATAIFEDAAGVAEEARPDEHAAFEEWLADAEETLATACGELDDPARAVATPQAEVGAPVLPVFEPAGATREVGATANQAESGAPDTGAAATPEPAVGQVAGGTDPEAVAVVRPANPGSSAEDDATSLSGPSLDDVDFPEFEEATEAESAEDTDVTGRTAVGDGAGAVETPVPGLSLEIRLRALDPDSFAALARELLAAEGWDPAPVSAVHPHDITGRPTAERSSEVAVWTVHRPIAGPVDREQIEDVAAQIHDDAEDVLVITSSQTREEAVEAAAEASIEVWDRSDIAEAVSGPLPDLLDRVGPDAE